MLVPDVDVSYFGGFISAHWLSRSKQKACAVPLLPSQL